MNTAGTILVIDNDAPTADFIAEALTDEGYRVHTVSNAECALTLALSLRPNLILCDLHMPGLDGISLVEDLRTHGLTEVPIVLMTSDAAAAKRLAPESISFCLLKPFDLDDLLDCVATHIRRSEPSRA
jgi:CheY-like chemotaxis protein